MTVDEDEGIEALIEAMERVRVSRPLSLHLLSSISRADTGLRSLSAPDSRDIREDACCEDWKAREVERLRRTSRVDLISYALSDIFLPCESEREGVPPSIQVSSC